MDVYHDGEKALPRTRRLRFPGYALAIGDYSLAYWIWGPNGLIEHRSDVLAWKVESDCPIMVRYPASPLAGSRWPRARQMGLLINPRRATAETMANLKRTILHFAGGVGGVDNAATYPNSTGDEKNSGRSASPLVRGSLFIPISVCRRFGDVEIGARAMIGPYTDLINHSAIRIGDDFLAAGIW